MNKVARDLLAKACVAQGEQYEGMPEAINLAAHRVLLSVHRAQDKEALRLRDGVLAVVEDAGGEHRVRAALDEPCAQVLEGSDASGGHDRDGHAAWAAVRAGWDWRRLGLLFARPSFGRLVAAYPTGEEQSSL